MNKKTVHILRYGTVAEKAHLKTAISSYDWLSINGNTAAYVSSAIAKFIVEDFFSKPDKGYFIDPITYAFQNNIRLLQSSSKATGEVSLKKSISKLVEMYGTPVDKVKDGMPVTPEDFQPEEARNVFCEKILSFQYNLVYTHIENNDLQKYIDYVSPEGASNLPQFRPKFLIPPYFYLDSQNASWEKWLDLNIKFINYATTVANEKYEKTPVYAQIVISKQILTDSIGIQRIIDAYQKASCTGFTIWVDDLNEHEAAYAELQGFVQLLQGLSPKPVYNMYGGYFSILLTHSKLKLLSGVSHGLEYGESRKVYPVGGGIPVSKYYYLPLHQRQDFTKAFYLLDHAGALDLSKANWGSSENYYKNICGCGQCKRIIKKEMINFVEFESRDFYEIHRKDHVLRRKKASSDTKQNCLYHYLLCKKMEFSRVNKGSIDTLLTQLSDMHKQYSCCDSIKDSDIEYLLTWTEVINFQLRKCQ